MAHMGAKSLPPKVIQVVSNFVGGFSIIFDLILSLFLSHSSSNSAGPASRNWLISILIPVDLTASTVSAAKAVYVQTWVQNPGVMSWASTVDIVQCRNRLIGCIASCLPWLKSTVQDVLVKGGVRLLKEMGRNGRGSCGVGFIMDMVTRRWSRGEEVRWRVLGGRDGDGKPGLSESSNKSSAMEVGGVWYKCKGVSKIQGYSVSIYCSLLV
jgi:hypothetical protein